MTQDEFLSQELVQECGLLWALIKRFFGFSSFSSNPVDMPYKIAILNKLRQNVLFKSRHRARIEPYSFMELLF